MISSISSLVGRDEIAPFFCTHNAPEIFPYSIAFRRISSVISSGLVTPCRRRLERNPPQNASPAPVASTAFTVRPPTVKMLFPKNTCAPLEPKVPGEVPSWWRWLQVLQIRNRNLRGPLWMLQCLLPEPRILSETCLLQVFSQK